MTLRILLRSPKTQTPPVSMCLHDCVVTMCGPVTGEKALLGSMRHGELGGTWHPDDRDMRHQTVGTICAGLRAAFGRFPANHDRRTVAYEIRKGGDTFGAGLHWPAR